MAYRSALPRLLATLLAFAALLAAFYAAGPEAAAAKRKGPAGTGKLAQARVAGRPLNCTRARALSRRSLPARLRQGVARRLRGCPSKAPAPATMGPGGPIYWGAWIGSQLTGDEAPWDMGAVSALEKIAGKSAAVINFSSPFADCSKSSCSYYDFPAAEMERIRSHGSIPFFSWASQSTPAGLDQPDFQLSDVIEGHHDAYIREWAEAARDWGHPFFLRFNWEMNGNWFAWAEGVNGNKGGEYVAAWRHVHDIFTEVGATNATWVWCPNVDPIGKLASLASLYPGDEYVDWTGLDGYNWGTNPARPDKWRSFDELFRSTYDEIATKIAPGKPLIVSEVGSSEYGGSKAKWIADALHSASTEYPQLRGLLWFEKYDDGMDWPIETSPASASAFAAGIQDPDFLGSSFASAPDGPIAPVG
jgi:beta-mannanase